MAGHTSEKRWGYNAEATTEGISNQVNGAVIAITAALDRGEALYQELLELWDWVGATDQLVADQLFFEKWNAREETQADASEVTMAKDLREAALAMHEIYGAMTNQVTSKADRISDLRRMT